jgi:H2-forming N5,N10-methylenetetrahydromethanopterin dehydrogenase-like enzyme
VLEGAKFEDDSVRIITEIARDESLPNIVHYIENIGKLSYIAKARLIARAACFQSKNYVYSNITDAADMMRVQDDFELVRLVSRIGLSSFDRNVDYMTAESLIESEHNIRIRRSKGALNLTMINTQRSESTSIQKVKSDEERKIRSKIPLIGGFGGSG